MAKIFDKRSVFFSVIILAMFGILLYFQLVPEIGQRAPVRDSEKQREYANKLKAEGLVEESIEAYKGYLASADIEPRVQANIYYLMGQMSEEAGKYEKALAYFYKAEIVDPRAGERQELGEHVVACLEKLNRGLDAQRALDKHTAVEEKEVQGKVLARIGNEKITEVQLNKELQRLPVWLQEEYAKPEKKMELLKQYLVQELLARKAKRLGFDKDPEVRKQLEEVKKQILVAKVVEQELEKKGKISDKDLELYYRANKEKYKEPKKRKIAFAVFGTEDEVQVVIKDLGTEGSEEKELPGQVEELVTEGQADINGIGEAGALVAESFSVDPGKLTKPVKLEKGYYLARVLEEIPEKEFTFAQVKEEVKVSYQKEREQEVFAELLTDTLEAEDVEIYEEELKAAK